ncbi:Methyltransferase-like protein [Arachis hypogaea]|nr:Methyltransferase-like protein [Arachis hypogaea]
MGRRQLGQQVLYVGKLWGGGGIGKKRKREKQRPTVHPNNRYAETPLDFVHLASFYPSFCPYVKYSTHSSVARSFLDWTDFNATRVLLLHDHSLHWWIPDGHLCPTVPNRSNYIHWLNDLLSYHIIPTNSICSQQGKVRGFDIGTGANCIYPLLGASFFGWSFVGSGSFVFFSVFGNVNSNPHIAELIEIKKVEDKEKALCVEGFHEGGARINICKEVGCLCLHYLLNGMSIRIRTMMDRPFFLESSGTSKEMVCPGGEKAFVACIIEDSSVLKHQFRWFTSMDFNGRQKIKSQVPCFKTLGGWGHHREDD